MSKTTNPTDKAHLARIQPVGPTHRAGSRRRARSSDVYRGELRRLAPYEGIARMVIARRQALGLTQKELAEHVGTSHSVISRIESGQNPTSVTTLQRLAQAFGTDLLVGFADDLEAPSICGLVTIPGRGEGDDDAAER
jgi:ribosome-binding protein aMBF1 (putative translation factor)